MTEEFLPRWEVEILLRWPVPMIGADREPDLLLAYDLAEAADEETNA